MGTGTVPPRATQSISSPTTRQETMMMHGESINKLSRVFMIINFVADFSVELAALEEFFLLLDHASTACVKA